MEVKRFGLGLDGNDKWLDARIARSGRRSEPDLAVGRDDAADRVANAEAKLIRKLSVPSQGRLYYVRYALKMGWSIERGPRADADRPVVPRPDQAAGASSRTSCARVDALEDAAARRPARRGEAVGLQRSAARERLPRRDHAPRRSSRASAAKQLGIEPVYKLVDTCAAEFEAATPYYYSTYESPISRVTRPATERCDRRFAFVDDEVRVTDRKKIVILGGGPNRIGQGIEFDYCCVHASSRPRSWASRP